MDVEKDYEDLLKLLRKHKVRFCLVGAYALAFHGYPRFTKDIDIFVEPSIANAERIVKALEEFGFRSLKLKATDFSKKGNVIQLGYEPLRVDILTAIDGITFDDLWKHKKSGCYGTTRIFFISRKDLIKNKKASGRKQDMADLEVLLKKK